MDFIGNKKVVKLLDNAIKRNFLSHAYLFSGPEYVGKNMLAYQFAANIIEGLGSLDLKKKIENMTTMDILDITPEIEEKKGIIKKKSIPVETIRQAQVDLSLFPCYGKYKVLIIDDAHMLSGSAQNSLLKTLEEPNKTSILILITHEVSRLLPTILSRVHEVNFSLVSEEEMQLGFGVENKNHSDMFFLGMGRPGLVHGIAASLEELEARRDWLKQLEIVQKGSVSERLRLAENFSKNIVRTFERLALWIWSLRGELSRDRSLQNEIYEKIEKIDRAIEILKTTNANSRLVLENLFISL